MSIVLLLIASNIFLVPSLHESYDLLFLDGVRYHISNKLKLCFMDLLNVYFFLRMNVSSSVCFKDQLGT